MMKKLILTSFVAAVTSLSAMAAEHTFDIEVSKLGAPIQPTMYGIFFEDINFGADGGLYAEMIKNRSFEFGNPLQGWRVSGNVEVRTDGCKFENNPHYLRLSYSGHKVKHTALENEGFFGVTLKKGETYRFSVWARCPEGGKSSLEVQLVDEALDRNYQCIGREAVTIEGKEWKKYEAELKCVADCPDGRLRIFLHDARNRKPSNSSQPAVTDVEHISLFPSTTWMNRPGGMRQDLAQALYDLHPGVFRFPGGCIVEGTDLEDRYQWKHTVGPVENRKYNLNRWQYEFDYRFYADYYQSYGLGFFEYFQLAEDFGAAPLPVLCCGMTCQFENDIKDEAKYHVAVEDLDPYIQDAVDLVEFANGDPETTKWGKLRAEMGHPAPFGLKYLAIGNEQWDYDQAHGHNGEANAAYTKRLKRFIDVLRVKCPDIKIIGTTGPNSEGWDFDLLQPRMKELGVDLYDEHFYRNEAWFLGKAKDKKGNLIKGCGALRYDSYDRKGPKIFAGEYACHGSGKFADGKEKKCNHFETSLYEAAFMTGIERNADIVHMATYAPLFAHVKGWQWRPDLIWFDNSRSMRSVSYYVQQLYSHYKGTNVLSCSMNKQPIAGQDGQDDLFATACYDKERNAVIVKVVNTGNVAQSVKFGWTGKKEDLKTGYKALKVITLHSDDLDADNTLDDPNHITPQTEILDPATSEFTVGAKSFQVFVFEK
ncbi:MAG: carbohydrate binding domain-containing protein [Bacteroidales bacterium]|nr:carbohydrate binding domain-containing protein [Candidatus Liminaster caballi]